MPVQYKDYYESLGVSRTASADEIKKSFRKLARLYHPDVAKDKKKSEEKFKEINEAYEVLSDAGNRRKYDELGANWKSGAEFRRRASAVSATRRIIAARVPATTGLNSATPASAVFLNNCLERADAAPVR